MSDPFDFAELIGVGGVAISAVPTNLGPKTYQRRAISLEACDKLQFEKYPYIQQHGVVLITEPEHPFTLKRVSTHTALPLRASFFLA
jgi:hypothetical protein